MVQEAVKDYKYPAEEHPLNRQVHQGISELLSLSSFRKDQRHSPGMGVQMPLLKTDFGDVPSISRLLHFRNRRLKANAVVVEVQYGWLSLYDEPRWGSTPIVPRMASLSICAGKSAVVIDGGRVIHHNNFLEFEEEKDHLISADVLFERRQQKRDESVVKEDLLTRRDVNPLRILSEMKTLMGRLRSEFEIQEQRRAESLLTPRQAAAVEALAKRAKDIRQHSGNRGFYDEYVIAALPNDQGNLAGLQIIFSAGSDRGTSTFKEKELLNEEPVSWVSPQVRSSIVTDGKVSIIIPEESIQDKWHYSAEGQIRIRSLRSRHLVVETIPAKIDETTRTSAFKGTVADYIGRAFGHFIDHRANPTTMEPECGAAIILATSVPLATRF